MKNYILIILVLTQLSFCTAQNADTTAVGIVYHVNENVKNKDEVYFKEIVQNWKNYLDAQEYVRSENIYWNHEVYDYPDYSLISLLLELRAIVNNNEKIQCSIIGLMPVKNDYYLLKTMYTQQDEATKMVELKYIISVYAKKQGDHFQFINSTQYHQEIYENRLIGDINYVIHPDHKFVEKDAIKMNTFNQRMAKLFESEPIKFDYILANNTNDLGDLLGLNFFSYSYQPVQSGGLADNYNAIIYAGNNSAYYPHEVVHLYTHAKFSRQYHSWVDEGVAAFFGGSTGYDLEWHVQKLRSFITDHPDYELRDLSKLQTEIPNGEFTTDFRYAIGGFLMRQIYENEGMQGLFDALQAGRSEEDYFALLENKLGIKPNEFEAYIKKEILKIKKIDESNLEQFRY